MYILLFTLYLLSLTDYPGDHIDRTTNTIRSVPLWPRVPYRRVCSGAPKDVGAIPLISEFVGMASYAPTTFPELPDDEGESDGSSIGDVAPSHRPSRECAMADAPGQPPVVAESAQTHTPPNPRAEALASAQAHAEELRQRRQNQPPPAPAKSVRHVAPHARGPTGGARGRARQVQHDIVNEGNDVPQFARAGQNIAATAMLLRGVPKPVDP